MSTVLELPTEIYEFLRRGTPQSLLIRGPPGCGKTTFSLALLQNFQGRRFYLTGRVSKAHLLRDYPWLTNGDSISVIDSAGRSDSVRQAARVMDHLPELIARPSAESSLEGLWLPEAVQKVLGETGGQEPVMVVIDSWESMIENYLGAARSLTTAAPDREELERVLLDQVSRSPVFLVLVLERDTPSQLDYLVNGVVQSGWEAHDGRPERWLHLLKLRGTRIDHPSYPFTLQDGRFQCIVPLPARFQADPAPPDADPAPQAGQLWPGSKEFEQAFGRLPLGTLSLLERDIAVPASAVRLLLIPMVASVIDAGGHVVHILPPNILPEELWSAYRTQFDEETLQRQLRMQPTTRARDLPEEIAPSILPPPVPDSDSFSAQTPEAARFLRHAAHGAANLSIVWVTGLRSLSATRGTLYTPETLPAIALDYVAGAPAHAMFVGVAGDPLMDSLKSTAALQLRLRARYGRVFIYGEDPATPSFVLSEGDEKNPYRLLRIV